MHQGKSFFAGNISHDESTAVHEYSGRENQYQLTFQVLVLYQHKAVVVCVPRQDLKDIAEDRRRKSSLKGSSTSRNLRPVDSSPSKPVNDACTLFALHQLFLSVLLPRLHHCTTRIFLQMHEDFCSLHEGVGRLRNYACLQGGLHTIVP